jgi:hypothetical protein
MADKKTMEFSRVKGLKILTESKDTSLIFFHLR